MEMQTIEVTYKYHVIYRDYPICESDINQFYKDYVLLCVVFDHKSNHFVHYFRETIETML